MPAEIRLNDGPQPTRTFTVMISEETPDTINDSNVEARHASNDRMGNWHRPSYEADQPGVAANYVAPDGSVHFFRRERSWVEAQHWEGFKPSNTWESLGALTDHGWWNTLDPAP
jgi:hypothetical protein